MTCVSHRHCFLWLLGSDDSFIMTECTGEMRFDSILPKSVNAMKADCVSVCASTAMQMPLRVRLQTRDTFILYESNYYNSNRCRCKAVTSTRALPAVQTPLPIGKASIFAS